MGGGGKGEYANDCLVVFLAGVFWDHFWCIAPGHRRGWGKNESQLPHVLIIGDSISIGYTPFVKKMMKDQAIVVHPRGNCEATVVGLAHLDEWLGKTEWAVIHFNFGLHDLKYVKDTKGTITDVGTGKQWVPVEAYEKNLDELATRLEKTGAKLIWCTTTPVPEGTKGRVAGDEIKYNEAAARVMQAHHISVDDLNAVAQKHLDLQSPHDVHFTGEGYKILAGAVTESIKAQLAPPAK